MQLVTYLSVLLAVIAASLGIFGTISVASDTIDSPRDTQFQRSELDVDRVLLRFDVRDDGAAVARVEYRFAREANGSAFTRFRDDIASNRTAYLNRFERRVAQTVENAENRTGRSMNVTNTTIHAETRQLPQPHSVVVYTFVWHGFAAEKQGKLTVGDALAGLFLDKTMQLQISWPDGYRTRTVDNSASEQRANAVIWSGPTWFDREGPRMKLVPEGFRIDPVPAALLLLSGLFAASGGVLWWHVDRSENEQPSAPTADETRPTHPDGDQSDSSQKPGVDPELMSNEERILWEITRRGGRVKQQELVAELDWSDAKVSRSVSALRERDAIERFRIGNQNVLSASTDEDHEEES
ncbi:DUF7343 domain-containing protein [Halocatena salina]|uniref:HTH marR-type domain-containing protein n=1 Tax=Halocatena salina TaxID=2934340 RepID=A0A8U0A7J1_9EURY|nr:hypothetical protein [Halocatena salina]UPM45095.1 hypothetical protein MW046_17185 [Halocatena salina]